MGHDVAAAESLPILKEDDQFWLRAFLIPDTPAASAPCNVLNIRS